MHGPTSFELSPIKAVELAASRIPGAVSLAQGIPSFETPQVIKDYTIEQIKRGNCDKYSLTLGLSELREEISLSLREEGLTYDPQDEIIVTAGSIEAISAAILATTNPGDEVILPSPTYASYLGALGLARCSVKHVALNEDRNFDFDIDRMRDAINKKTRVILFCSPNNPTGTLFSEEKTRAIVDLAEKHNLTLIIDEVYKDFYYEDLPHFSACRVEAGRNRIIRVCSFSKAYAMTGWRVGFVHADRHLISQMLKYHDALVTCAPVVSQYAAIAALRFGHTYLEKFKQEFKQRRDLVLSKLDSLPFVFDYQVPRATYFVFPRVKDTIALARDSRALAYDILDKVKLALVPGIAFGPSGESHLRISYGRERAEIEEGMSRLQEYFTKPHSQRKTPRHNPTPRPFRDFLESMLALGAKIFLRRNNPLVVGIAGTRNKTVFKRILEEYLSKQVPTRAGVLSYNTKTGLPLSILDLSPPCSRFQWMLRFLYKALFALDSSKILILEYGADRIEQAESLLSICKPNYLVITGLEGGNPEIDLKGATEALRLLAQAVPRENVLFCAQDSLLSSLEHNWPIQNGFDSADLNTMEIAKSAAIMLSQKIKQSF